MEQEENLDLVEEGDEKDEEEDGLSLYNNKEEGGEAEPDNEADLGAYRNSYYTMSDDQL